MDDADLLANYVRTGSEEDFAVLVKRHADWVYSVCRRHVGEGLAEDVTQAVFATLARRARHIKAGVSISGWLFKTARYASATARKIENRRVKHERRAAAMKSEQAAGAAEQEWQEILPELDDAVARLPERDSRLVLLRFYQGLSHQEAAAVVGISPVAAQKRLSRAIEKLRARLKNFPLVLTPGVLEHGLEHQVVCAAPSQVVSGSVSVANAAPSAQVQLIMKGIVIMKRLYVLKLAGAAAGLVTLLAAAGVAVWVALPAKAAAPVTLVAAPVAAASQPAQAEQATGGDGVEFHIVADAVTTSAEDLKTMDSRLEPGGVGPVPQAGDTIRWVEVEHPKDFDPRGVPPETRVWNGQHFLPVLITPEASMDHSGNHSKDQSQTAGWSFADARESSDNNGNRDVSFTFDPRGTKLFAELTTHWCDLAAQRKDIPHARVQVAIMLENKIINAPKINEPLVTGSAVITGGRNGLSEEEMKRLIAIMTPPTTEPSAGGNSNAGGI